MLDEYYIPKTGSFLGELANELQQDEFIIEFASGGPKNYAFLTNKNRSKTVVKGLTLNFENSQIVNFSSIRDHVVNITTTNSPLLSSSSSSATNVVVVNDDNLLHVNQFNIQRNKLCWELKNVYIKKKYQIVYTKRVLVGDNTFPFGY